MASKLGNWLKEEREAREISRQYLAGLLGYKNLNNGARWIALIEENGEADSHWRINRNRTMRIEQLIRWIVALFYLDPEKAVLLAAIDDAERKQAVRKESIDPADLEPVKLLARPLLAVCIEVALPPGLPSDSTVPELLKHVPQWVTDLYKRDSRRVHVILGQKRLEPIPVPADGPLELVSAEAGPFMQVRGRGAKFRLRM